MHSFVLDLPTIHGWCAEEVSGQVLSCVQECGCNIILPEVAIDKYSTTDSAQELIEIGKIIKAEEFLYNQFEVRYFRIGESQIAAMAIASEIMNEKEQVCYCISDENLVHTACNDAGIPNLGSVGVGAHFVDEAGIDFDTAVDMMKRMRQNGLNLPINYTALLKEKSARFPAF